MTTNAAVDPVTFAVVRNGLVSAAREMYTVFKRTTMLAIIYEFNDFGVSLFDHRLNLIADAPGIPIFLGSLDTCIERTLEEIGGPEVLREGDVLLNNHPYLTAGQPADAAVILPIFHDGEIIAYAALRAHMGDFGGRGWYPVDSTELFQEGTLLPGVKLFEAGELNETIVRIIRANSRIPNETVGSIMGGVAAAHACRRKVLALVEKYGLDVYYDVIDQALDHGEKIARAAIEEIPDGVYSYVDYLDGNGIDDEPVKVSCEITIEGSNVTIDLSGSDPQQGAPINCPWGYTLTTARFAMKRITTPDLPATSGEYRPVTVIAPEGSLYNPTHPAPCFIGAWGSIRLSDVIVQALAPALPERIPAESGGDLAVCSVRLRHLESGRWCIFAEFGALGMGASYGKDGMNALIHPTEAGCESLPAELVETRVPILRRSWELICDSGGPGEFRGGLSAKSEWEFRSTGIVNAITEKTKASVTRGLAGGHAAPFNNLLTVFPGTDRELRLGKKSDIKIAPGDVFTMRAGGGGGYGDPLRRPPEKVLEDVRNGYVSVGEAKRSYGVIVDDQTLELDEEATAEYRAGSERHPANS
ncbi:MAG TPA: hydantoinase B/oxoprolinase family protein [Actinomycetota bacterium]|nr:hydantoinase B/oxoprolinase family protein [Actinomycetota bacterium]